jgi:hypothetical protein
MLPLLLFHFMADLINRLQSPDGDVIDCVPSHLQPAFDHPKLRGQKPAVRGVLTH